MPQELNNTATPPTSSAPVSTPESGTINTSENATTSVSHEQNVVEQPNVTSTPSTSPETTANVQTETTQRNYEAEAGKVSQLERENQAYQRQLKELDDIFESDPEAYAAWAKGFEKKHNRKLPSYAEVYGTGEPTAVQQPNQNYNQQNQVTNQSIDPRVIKEQLKAELKQEDANDKYWTEKISKFWDAVPDLDPKKIESAEDRVKAGETMQKVMKIADARSSTLGEDPTEAMINAYNSLPENLNKRIQDAEDTGRTIGMQTAFANGAATSNPGSSPSSQPTGSNTVKMTDMELDMYNKLIKQGRADTAKAFADRVARGG